MVLIWFTWWIATRLANFRNELIRLEVDSGRTKKDIKYLKRGLTRVERKLDKLITHLMAKKIDFRDKQSSKPDFVFNPPFTTFAAFKFDSHAYYPSQAQEP